MELLGDCGDDAVGFGKLLLGILELFDGMGDTADGDVWLDRLVLRSTSLPGLSGDGD